jgi:ATP-dependent DNA helicase RecG
MEAARSADAHRAQPLPRAPGSGEPLSREALLAAPLRSLPGPSLLEQPLTALRGAGPRLAEIAAALGVRTVGDLLAHLPHSYRDRSDLRGVGELRLGEQATVLVECHGARVRPTRRRRLKIVEARVSDATGAAKAIWFNQAWLAERLGEGTRLLLHGKLDKRGFRVSEHELLPEGEGELKGGTGKHTVGIVPVHPATEGIRPQRLRELAWRALPRAVHAVEPLPARLRVDRGLPGAAEALVAAHFPQTTEEAAEGRTRLAFEELLLYQAALASRRRRRRGARPARALGAPAEAVREWVGSLPFEPTGDQRRAIDQIDADLRSSEPMQRLLMGEVGSGKTVVALYAMLRAAGAGRQAALMAPTETLAEQHHRTLEVLLATGGLSADLLTAATPDATRRRLVKRLADAEPALVVGTHALIEEEVEFADLTVAVVDEQHRFGVRQRAALDAKAPAGFAPHVLHMTATPIPRTLSLTAYGDLDATALRELPAGRKPIRTWVVGGDERAQAYELLRERLREGRQAYVVCPLVSESEALQARAATEEAERLAGAELAEFEVDVLHGRMPSPAKQAAMSRFASGQTDVLVATSVIEVGIDVPNATVMVVEDADRYGLSQLHQLRGRVGRGEHASCCILFGEPGSDAARARLAAIASEGDGFRLAEVDLSIRGEGEILGTRQHGLPRFRAATLPEDAALLLEARDWVAGALAEHGSLEAPALGPLLDEARRRFGDERVEQLEA